MVTSRSLQADAAGGAVLDYLRCEDLDCVKATDAVVALGAKAVPLLLAIAREGVAADVAAQLPGGTAVIARIRAVDALGRISNGRALDALTAVTKDPDARLRAAAAQALGHLEAAGGVPTLTPLLRDADDRVREAAAAALASIGDAQALPALRLALDSETVAHVRRAVQTALEQIERRRKEP